MCGRFTHLRPLLTTLTDTFPEFELPNQLTPRYNITPTQDVAVVANNNPGKIDLFRWGLIPSWAKDPTIGNRMINARSETIAQKPSFRTAYKRRRCLVLADGYYEWRKEPDGGRKNAVLHPHGVKAALRLRGAVGTVATVERRRCGSVMHNPHVSRPTRCWSRFIIVCR